MSRSATEAVVRSLAADYSSSAREYACRWAPAILPLALPLLETLPLRKARRVLDVGTGVGALLPHLQFEAPHARVLGVDRSEGMLRTGRGEHVYPVGVMDAVSLGFPAGVFDVATLVFMLFHVLRPIEALREVRRVLRRGGTIGTVTWHEEDPGLPAAVIWDEELDRRGASPDPRDARVRRHDLVDRPEKIARLLERSGFRSVEVWTRRFEVRWHREALLRLQEGCGTAGRRLASLDSAERASCVAAVRKRVDAMSRSELVWRPVVLHASATAG